MVKKEAFSNSRLNLRYGDFGLFDLFQPICSVSLTPSILYYPNDSNLKKNESPLCVDSEGVSSSILNVPHIPAVRKHCCPHWIFKIGKIVCSSGPRHMYGETHKGYCSLYDCEPQFVEGLCQLLVVILAHLPRAREYTVEQMELVVLVLIWVSIACNVRRVWMRPWITSCQNPSGFSAALNRLS
jgi:hypothetical protein